MSHQDSFPRGSGTRKVPSVMSVIHFPSNLEADYQAYLAPEKIRITKQGCWLCILLYSAFGILDIWAIESAVYEVWAIRAIVVTFAMIVVGIATWLPDRLISHYSAIVALFFMLLGLGIETMVFLTRPADPAWSGYYVGLILISMALYTWTFLRPVFAAIIGAIFVAVYIYIAVWVQGMVQESRVSVLLVNCSFLVAANIVGLFTLNSRERFSRQAYLLKYALGRDLEMKEEAKRQSDYLAEHDPLTGIPNRIHFRRRINEMIERVKDTEKQVAVLFIDLDEFKPINDMYGHSIGDLVLQIISKRIKSCVRSSDAIARFGGDEFAVGLELSSQQSGLVDRVGRSIAETISAPIAEDGKKLRVTASIGVAIFPIQATNADELLALADKQMYEVKRSGKMSVSVAPYQSPSI